MSDEKKPVTGVPEPPPEGQWWEVLGVSRYADSQQVKEACRMLARLWHPDVNSGSLEATEVMKRVNIALEQFKKSEPQEGIDEKPF